MSELKHDVVEEKLLKLYGAPMVKLADVCEQYLGTGIHQAALRAKRGKLPFPVFKPNPASHKSPWMVLVSDLAKYVVSVGASSASFWNKAAT